VDGNVPDSKVPEGKVPVGKVLEGMGVLENEQAMKSTASRLANPST